MELHELVYLGTKAPSGHNSQPWKFKTEENSIEIHPDFSYALPVVDPDHRELYISLGCAGENIRMAASYYGIDAAWSVKKDKNNTDYIDIHLSKSHFKKDSNIIKNIEKRQSNRKVYNGKTITNDVIKILEQVALEANICSYFFKRGTVEFDIIQDYILKGNEIQMNDPNFKKELVSWIRFNKKHVDKTNDGLAYQVMGSPQMPKFLGQLVVRAFLNPKKQNRSDKLKINSSSHFIVITSKNNTIKEWVALGFYMELLLLKLTELGIANAYLNPPCEISQLAEELKKSLPLHNEFPSIILRVGFAEKTPYSPRKRVREVIYDS